jgi:hypothetical protein
MRGWMTVNLVLAMLAAPAIAMPVIEFSPDPSNAGNWNYNGDTQIMSFDQDVRVDQAVSSNSDALVGAKVYLPSLKVSGSSGTYSLTPLGTSQVKITNSSGSQTYLTGTLATGDLTTVGTMAGAYSSFSTDITNVVVTSQGQALGSTALDLIAGMAHPSLDLQFSLDGGNGSHFHSFKSMIDGGFSGTSGFSGAMSVPEPTTIALLGMGGLALVRRHRRT